MKKIKSDLKFTKSVRKAPQQICNRFSEHCYRQLPLNVEVVKFEMFAYNRLYFNKSTC